MATQRFAALLAALVISLAYAAPARAIKIPADWCKPLSAVAKSFAELRDIGAIEEKHLAYVRQLARERGSDPTVVRSMEITLRRIYTKQRLLTPDEIEESTFKRCIENVGDLGEES